MGRLEWSIAIGVLIALTFGTSLAWAASKPNSKGSYYSENPYVEIQVGKSLTWVRLYTNCNSNEPWYSPEVPLRHDVFSFDKQTTVDGTSSDVLFTGKFNGGEFKGKVHIVGSACPEQSYTTRYSAGGGGST